MALSRWLAVGQQLMANGPTANSQQPTASTVPDHDSRLRSLAAARWRIAITLTAVMVAVYFGFILLIAYDKPLMGRLVTRGLSVGILLGVIVILASFLLTWIYVRWANRHYDARLESLRPGQP